MKRQNFSMVKDDTQSVLFHELGKTKRPIFLFSTILFMLLLVSCKKSMNEFPGQEPGEAGLSNQSSGANVSSSEELVPFDQTLFVPCANGGAGEEVALTGSLKTIEHIIYNDRGFTFDYHAIAQGITGIGLSTGETFEASGGNKGTITGEFGEDGQYTRVFMTQMRIVGQKSVFKIFYKTKITITADGKIKTTIDEESVDCNM